MSTALSELDVIIDYTNWRGERAARRVRPQELRWRKSKWHPGPQWIIEAWDLDKNEGRELTLVNIHSIRKAT